jgi:putative glutamine amidotransferase
LRVSARAPDGVIEAIEATGNSFCVGVQWHPERAASAHRDLLFGVFLSACRSRASGPPKRDP